MKKIKKLLFFMTLSLMLGCSTEDDGGGTNPPVDPPVEEEVPVAVDDEFSTTENTSLAITGSVLMDNDTVFDFARITKFESETEAGGTVVAGSNGIYTYTPPQDFTGEDSFSYTICDRAATPNCSTGTVNITVTGSSPVAVDDAFETQEDKILKIIAHLNNDDLADNAAISEVGVEGTRGTVVLENDGDILYTPEEGFAGEDSFTYTICDDDETPSCSTATVTITVIDAGSPVAVDDEVVVEVNGSAVFTSLLSNDNAIDDAVITSINSDNTQGTVVLNSNGSVSYTAASGLEGEDSFTYTICDDDEPANCSTATVTVQVVQPVVLDIPAALEDYYSGVVFSQDPVLLKAALAAVTERQHVNKLEYVMRHDYLYDADASLTDPEYVVLMYTGDLRHWTEYQEGDVSEGETFNTEHIYPQSFLATTEAKNDLHHMRVADITINGLRSNHPFTTGSGDAELKNDDTWYPGDEWKGDVARMVMYVHLKYGEPFSDVGTLEMFLRWNVEDPVSPFEMQRQEIIEGAQGNRNPFIDNPYLATLIWDGPEAENLWD